MVEVLPVGLLMAIGVVFLFLKWLSAKKENYKLRNVVSAQNRELTELRDLFLAMDTGENTEQLLLAVHERAAREHQLESLEYRTS